MESGAWDRTEDLRPEDTPLDLAISNLDHSQAIYLASARVLAQDCSKDNTLGFNHASQDLVNTFRDTLTTIVASDELGTQEKANYIAALFKGHDSDRIQCFRELAPKTYFSEIPIPFEQVSDKLIFSFGEIESPDVLVERIVKDYITLLEKDNTQLHNNLSPTVAIEPHIDKPNHWVDIAKISAGTAISTLIVYKLLKRQSSN